MTAWQCASQARNGRSLALRVALHAAILRKVISVYGGIINVRIIDVKKLEKTPTRKEKIT